RRGERHAGLEAGDRLVLGAVVLEHAPEISEAAQQQQIAQEDPRADQALDEPEEERGVELVLDQRREADRDQEEQSYGEQDRYDDRAGPHTAGDLVLLVRQLGGGGDSERSDA